MSSTPTSRRLTVWRGIQAAVWLLGLAIIVLLVVRPTLGIALMWNVLIPVAPALLVFAPGVWRNICPLATTALMPRHMGFSGRRILGHRARIALNLAGVGLLLTIVPLRHVLLDTNGPGSAMLLLAVAALAFGMGMGFEWKSGWCSGLCPVHGVEKLYGSKPLVTTPNAHCDSCERCVGPCPDSTANMHPLLGPPWWTQRLTQTLLVGGFPGFVWGWFHVPDGLPLNVANLTQTYAWPAAGMAVTITLFLILQRMTNKQDQLRLARLFAAAAVCTYYWYRIPALVGLGLFPADGVLLDLSGVLGDGFVWSSRAAVTSLFVGWLVLHSGAQREWARRPAFAQVRITAISRSPRPAPATHFAHVAAEATSHHDPALAHERS